jgi:hypothetical protein
MSFRYRAYLGETVYAEWDELGRLVLTTEHADEATNTIILKPEMLNALEQCLSLNKSLDHQNGGIPGKRVSYQAAGLTF